MQPSNIHYCIVQSALNRKKKYLKKWSIPVFEQTDSNLKYLSKINVYLISPKISNKKKKRLVQCPVAWWERHDIHSTLLQVYSTTVRKIGLHYIPSGCKDMKDNKKQNNTRKIKI